MLEARAPQAKIVETHNTVPIIVPTLHVSVYRTCEILKSCQGRRFQNDGPPFFSMDRAAVVACYYAD